MEAERADYRAVLAGVNALGENQRDAALAQREHGGRLGRLEAKADEHSRDLATLKAGVRSVEEHVVELKDLVVRALDR